MKLSTNNPFNKLVPKYSETYLFLASITFIILFIINAEFLSTFFNFLFARDFKSAVLAIFFILGCVMSIYYVFSNKKPLNFIKISMLIFLITLNFVISLESFTYSLDNRINFWLIFPVLNLIHSFFIVLLFRLEIINENSISNKNAKMHEIILGSLSTIIIIFLSNHLLNNHWTITFSISLTYSLFLNNLLTKIIFKDN